MAAQQNIITNGRGSDDNEKKICLHIRLTHGHSYLILSSLSEHQVNNFMIVILRMECLLLKTKF